MRTIIQNALQQIEESQQESGSSELFMSEEMTEYLDELKQHSDAIRERTRQLRTRIQSLND